MNLPIRSIWGYIASLGLLILTPCTAISQLPKETPPQTGGRSGGTRGCDARETIASTNLPALMLLTPSRALAKTTGPNPTFAWFIRDAAPQSLTFRLYQYESNSQTVRQIMHDDHIVSQPGIMVLSLPEIALSVGQRYLWQVELVCNPNRPSGNVFAEADLEVVAIEPALAMKLAKTEDLNDRATLYAEAGFWHDALTLMLVDDRSVGTRKAMLDDQIVFLLRQMVITDAELNSLRMSSIHWLPLNPK